MNNVSKIADVNISFLKKHFKDDFTFKYRTIKTKYINAGICFIDGMCDSNLLDGSVCKAITNWSGKLTPDSFQNSILYSGETENIFDFTDIVKSVLSGNTVVFADGMDFAISVNTKGYKTRSVDEPSGEKAVRGPKDGFNENLVTNIALIRRRIKNDDLAFEEGVLGRRSNTAICFCYLKSLVNDDVLKSFKEKVMSVDFDGICDSNLISENIKSAVMSPFKTVGSTERPDNVAARLLEGKVALIVDGSPVVLTAPYLFIDNFKINDDYYLNFYYSSFIRLMRILCFFVSISIPAMYIAFVNFHWDFIPTSLALNIREAHVNIAISTVIECVLMLTILEIIKESGQRLNSGAGQAVSIVGALVIGQAAVEANFISAPMVIVVGLSAITELVNLSTTSASIILRMFLILLSSILGFFGFFFGWVAICIHLLNLKSFGVRYLSEILLKSENGRMDSILRFPWKNLYKRPSFAKDSVRAYHEKNI